MLKSKFSVKVAMLCLIAVPALAGSGGEHHGPDVVELLARTLNVAIFAWILYFFLKSPLADFFKNRAARIKQDLEMAKSSREEAERRLAEIEAKMAGLDEELDQIAQKAREEAEAESERMKLKVEEETAKIRKQAEQEIEQAKVDAIKKVKTHIVDLAIQRVESEIAGRVTTEDQDRLIQEFAEKMGV